MKPCAELEGDETKDGVKEKKTGAAMCRSLAKCHNCIDISFAVRRNALNENVREV